jgi:hypothetical protein
MENKKRIPFDKLNQYRGKLKECAAELEATVVQLKKVASQLEEGALIGLAGTAFGSALTEQLAPAIMRLHDKTIEVEQDIQNTIEREWTDLEKRIQGTMGR